MARSRSSASILRAASMTDRRVSGKRSWPALSIGSSRMGIPVGWGLPPHLQCRAAWAYRARLAGVYAAGQGTDKWGLFVAQGFDGVEAGRFPRGIHAKNDADKRAHHQGGDDPENREGGGHFEAVLQKQRNESAKNNA